jgi:hypothetical protein
MIAAMYAPKSSEQSGVAKDAKSVAPILRDKGPKRRPPWRPARAATPC